MTFSIKSAHIYLIMLFSLEMIPINDDVDHAWSEFERYSTNGYIRQLLDDQTTALDKEMTADIT